MEKKYCPTTREVCNTHIGQCSTTCFLLSGSMEKKILFNETADHEKRSLTKPLELSEMQEAVDVINEGCHFMDDSEKEKVQKLIYEYENLKYFAATNSALWIEFNTYPDNVDFNISKKL